MAQQKTPPRYVPTLTEVVSPVAGAAPQQAASFSQEQLIHRVLQRVDLTLDRRLREAIATIVLEQTRTLGPALREEIEEVVRKTVSDALAEEFSTQGSPGQPAQ